MSKKTGKKLRFATDETSASETCLLTYLLTCSCFSSLLAVTRVVFVGGGAGELPPHMDLPFPPTGLSENSGGMERGRGGEGKGKGKGGETTCLTSPPTGFCLKYRPGCHLTDRHQVACCSKLRLIATTLSAPVVTDRFCLCVVRQEHRRCIRNNIAMLDRKTLQILLNPN